MKLTLLLAALLLTGCFRPRGNYNGVVDSINCDAIQGWAFDWNRPHVPADIDIYDGDKLIVKIKADLARPDLQGNDPNHGFRLSPVPPTLLDHKAHQVHVRYGDTQIEITNSPKPVTCP